VQIKGKVTAEGNASETLTAVNIKIKGTTGGTSTGVDGAYSLRVTKGVTLVFSYVGYLNKEVKVGDNLTINVALKSEAKELGEVLVVGTYGSTTNKLTKTGSATTISNADFKNTIVNGVDEILQGRVAGVNVISTSGEPGADIIVTIRGNSSINGSNQPLYVIDGFPVPPSNDAPTTTGAGQGSGNANGLFGLNPNDIETLTVLKDGDATAIYGSRAANGVVLITTKKGKSGESTIEVTNKSTIGVISSPYQMMNSQQYAEIKNEQSIRNNTPVLFDVESFAKRPSTNWLKEITRNSLRQETNLSFRGGVGATNYFISASYLKETGVVVNSGNERGNVRFNINTDVKKWYSIRAQFAITRQNQLVGITGARGWPNRGGPILNSLRAAPFFDNDPDALTLDNAIDGVVIGGLTFNPVLEQNLKNDNRLQDQVISNLENIFYLTPKRNLELHVTVGTSYNYTGRRTIQPPAIDIVSLGTAQQGDAKTISYNGNVFLLHKLKLKAFSINNTIGAEFTEITNESNASIATNLDYASIALNNLGSGRVQRISSTKSANLNQSGFYRLLFNYDNKYLLSGSLRLDGSSRFAENNKLGLFPSLGFTWNASEESFIKNKLRFVDLAKFRVSYAVVGNDRSLPEYRSIRLYNNGFYETGISQGAAPFVSLVPQQPSNVNLKWESSSLFNIATDISLFKDKLGISFEYYDKLTKGLLQNVPFPTQSGYNNVWSNVGTIQNRGIEISLNTKLVQNKDFTWSSNFNFSNNRTILVDLGAFDPTANLANLGGNLLGGSAKALIPGQELGLFYGYKIDGLYQMSDFDNAGRPVAGLPIFTAGTAPDTRPGRLKFVNTNGSTYTNPLTGRINGNVNDSDRVVIGNSAPEFTIGFTNNFTYKRFSLSFLFTGTYGNDIQNVVQAFIGSGNLASQGVAFNQTEEWYKNHWTPKNQHNDTRFPAVQTGTAVLTTDAVSSQIEDGSFLRLKNVTLGYNFNVKKTKFFKTLNVFVTGTDLLLITNYSGFDPETSSYGTDVRLQGIDYGSYPRNRNITIGLSTTF
jgi:TonB-linked SusC/RagA family outer membrane protein